MTTISLKIPPELEGRLNAVARRKRISKSAVIREALEQALPSSHRVAKASLPKGSVLERVTDEIGSCEGPGDLSANPKYMEGFGR